MLVDCVYKNIEDERPIPDKILVNGLSMDEVGCRSVVKVHGKYLFFLTKTPRDNEFNTRYDQLQSGAVLLKKRTNLGPVLESSYQASFQPVGDTCFKNCVELSAWSEWSECGSECGKSTMKRTLQTPRTRTRRSDACYSVEETALCEICPCSGTISDNSNYAHEKEVNTYLVQSGCQSAEPVRNKWCVGFCEDNWSVNIPTKVAVKTLRMVCESGEVEFQNVAIVEECGCVKRHEDDFLYDFLESSNSFG